MRGGFTGNRGVFGTPFFDDNLLGPDRAFPPEEAGREARCYRQVIVGALGRLDLEDALVALVQLAGGRLYPPDVHAGQDLEERLDDVVQVGGKKLELFARGQYLRGHCCG